MLLKSSFFFSGKHLKNYIFSSKYFISSKKFNSKQCYYKILNVSTEATQEEIKKSYLDLAKKYHPDTKFGDKVQEEKFKEIQEAYNVLSNEIQRKIYNEENGIESYWAHQNIGADFGENEEIYQKFSKEKINHEKMNEQIKIDEQFTKYFETKYFKNHDYFYKPPMEDDPFQMTEKLLRQKQEITRKKRENYVLHNPFTSHAFYEEKNAKINKIPFFLEILNDIKFPILLLFSLYTVYIVITALYESSEEKKMIERTKFVEKGSGYQLKLMPLNLA